jgi:hypothetical protein
MKKTYRVSIKIWSPELQQFIIPGKYYDVRASAKIFAIAKALNIARKEMPELQIAWNSCQRIKKEK